MRIAKYRNIIVALLMMTFVGQVVASTSVSCQNEPVSPQSQEKMMDSGMMDHSQHMTLSDSPADDIAFECCPDCDCSVGGCAALVLPASQPAFTSHLSSFTTSYNELAENQLTVSLFRPPIAR